jgi:adenine deaminase
MIVSEVMRLLAISFAFLAVATAQPFDIVIRNGHIIDGAGSPWYSGDIGIRAGRIAAIGQLANRPARKTIDAHGDVVAPVLSTCSASPKSPYW